MPIVKYNKSGVVLEPREIPEEKVAQYIIDGWQVIPEENRASANTPPAIIPEESPIALDKVQTMPIRKRGRPKRGA